MRTSASPRRAGLTAVAVGALLAACSSSPATPGPSGSAPAGGTSPSFSPPPGTDAPADSAPAVASHVTVRLRPTTVRVPGSLRQAPFDRARQLAVPSGWTVSVYARIPKARFMALLPDGRVLVAQPSTGRVLVLRRAGDVGTATPYLSGLTQPHGLAVATLGGQQWVYVAESNRVRRYPFQAGDTTARPGQTIVDKLPDASLPELKGAYAHALKNIAISPDGYLYLGIGSSCNACATDTTSDPRRGAVYRYPVAGGPGQLYTSGLRNAEGLAVVPGTNEVWAAVNNRDNIAYPRHQDFDLDGADDYGKVMPSYVDNHPPEEFLRLRAGADFGWPFCNPNPDRTLGMRDMPFDQDAELNGDGHVDCAGMDRVQEGIPAHSAPLGLSFLTGAKVPKDLRGGAVVTLHGSWNATTPVGYKVIWWEWDPKVGRPAPAQDLMLGFIGLGTPPSAAWGRPVDTIADADGSLLVSDDLSGTIYRLAAPS
jgi:glucose/arabinose dehydrogenase